MALSEGYKKYMKSPRWFQYRERRIAKANFECEICSNHGCTLHVHHLTYKNFMHERMEDTLVVCKNCHKYVDRIRKILKRLSKGDPMLFREAKRICKSYGYPFDMKSNSRKPVKDLWKTLKSVEDGTYEFPQDIINSLSSLELDCLRKLLRS